MTVRGSVQDHASVTYKPQTDWHCTGHVKTPMAIASVTLHISDE